MTSNDAHRLQRPVVRGVDGSEGARIALRVAARLAAELDLRPVVAHVVQPQPAVTGFGSTADQPRTLPLDTLLAGGEALVDRVLCEASRSRGSERRVAEELGRVSERGGLVSSR